MRFRHIRESHTPEVQSFDLTLRENQPNACLIEYISTIGITKVDMAIEKLQKPNPYTRYHVDKRHPNGAAIRSTSKGWVTADEFDQTERAVMAAADEVIARNPRG